MLPPIPSWDGLHPLVIHFPIALFLVTPLFVGLALVLPKHGPWFARSACILLLMGTAAAILALETGEAAAEYVTHGPAVEKILKHHDELAHRTALAYGVITVLYGGNVVLLPLFVEKLRTRKFAVIANGIALLVLMAASALLANTAHLGGLMVHKYGVHAITAGGGADADAGDEYDY